MSQPPSNVPELACALETSRFGKWGEIYCVVFARAECRCEYCGFDFASELSSWIGFWQFDHILPKSKYWNLGGPRFCGYSQTCTEYSNLALACNACNKLKGVFDPGDGVVDHTAADMTVEQRKLVVWRAREYVRLQREGWRETFDQVGVILAQVRKSTAPTIRMNLTQAIN